MRWGGSFKKNIVTLSSYLLCLTIMLDPVNVIFGLKVPLFIFFVFSLLINFKSDFKYVPILSVIILLQFISVFFGLLDNRSFKYPLTIQYLIYFISYICLLWRKHIDIFKPFAISSIIVSILSIIVFIAMTSYPDFFELVYMWSKAHDDVIIIAKRTFLGVEFNQVFYKSIPLVVFPSAVFLYKLVYERNNRIRNCILVSLFLFALFCSGNRAMLGALFLVVFLVSYRKFAKVKFFVPIMIVFFIVAMYILFLAITDTTEVSADIKKGHMLSYVDYFTEKWYLLPFGSGAGSLFETRDYGMTSITEMTYMELLRMYGLIGLCLILYFFLIPLFHYGKITKNIRYWKPFSISYVIYLLISGSNPYLISSTGFLCILLMFTVVSNPKYMINYENNSKS